MADKCTTLPRLPRLLLMLLLLLSPQQAGPTCQNTKSPRLMHTSIKHNYTTCSLPSLKSEYTPESLQWQLLLLHVLLLLVG